MRVYPPVHPLLSDGWPYMARTIFISYSSRDAGLAAELNDALCRASFATWFAPRDVEPGASFAEGIEAGIRDAALVVLLFTSSSNRSPHVALELSLATNARRPVLPLRLEQVEPVGATRYFLGLSQWFDVSPQLADSMDAVVGRIRVLLAEDTGQARAGFRVKPGELLAHRDAMQLGFVFAAATVVHARHRADPALLDRMSGLAHEAQLLGGRLAVPVDLRWFAPETLHAEPVTATFVGRVRRHVDRIHAHLDSRGALPAACALLLSYHVAGSALYLSDTTEANRRSVVSRWERIAAHVELPTGCLDDLRSHVTANRDILAATRSFHERAVTHLDDRLIFDLAFARFRANAWKAGLHAARAVHLHGQGQPDELVEDMMSSAEAYADALGINLEKLPVRTGNEAADSAVALHHLITWVGSAKDVSILFGHRFSAVLDAAYKSALVLWFCHRDYPDDSLVTGLIDSVTEALRRAAIPADLWSDFAVAARSRADHESVRRCIFDMQSGVEEYLSGLAAGAFDQPEA
jgi:hypothetical protein